LFGVLREIQQIQSRPLSVSHRALGPFRGGTHPGQTTPHALRLLYPLIRTGGWSGSFAFSVQSGVWFVGGGRPQEVAKPPAPKPDQMGPRTKKKNRGGFWIGEGALLTRGWAGDHVLGWPPELTLHQPSRWFYAVIEPGRSVYPMHPGGEKAIHPKNKFHPRFSGTPERGDRGSQGREGAGGRTGKGRGAATGPGGGKTNR